MDGENGGPAPRSAIPLVAGDQTPVYAGRLEIRPADHAALVDGRPLVLTVRELQLLTELAHNAERVMTREELYETVWGRSYKQSDRSVDVYVGRLRVEAKQGTAGAALHSHPYRHRLPLLTAGLRCQVARARRRDLHPFYKCATRT